MDFDAYQVKKPKCPGCKRELFQKSKIIIIDYEVRHSVLCLICNSAYKVDYKIEELKDGCGSKEDQKAE